MSRYLGTTTRLAAALHRNAARATLILLASACDSPDDRTGPIGSDPAAQPAPRSSVTSAYGHDLNSFVDADGATLEKGNPRPTPPPPTAELRWTLEKASPADLGRRALEAQVEAAFEAWQDALYAAGSKVRLRRVSAEDRPDITVGFRSANHRDQCADGALGAFTSPHGTMAHTWDYGAACPKHRGAIHLNASLPWVLNGLNRKGEFDVRTVLVHEIGHILGLAHQAENPAAAMYEEYGGTKWQIPLAEGHLAKAALGR